jgi:hypothetical protein
MDGEKKSHELENKKNNLISYDIQCIEINKINNFSNDNSGEDIGGQMEKKSPNQISGFNCVKCNYFTRFKRDYNKHLKTKKHNYANLEQNINQCPFCNKTYSSSSNLWKHKKNCNNELINNKSDESLQELKQDKPKEQNQSEMIYELIKQNKELQVFLMEQNNKIMELTKNQTTIINQNNTTNNNNQFNLNFFLNEQCKNALNIQDFLDNIQLNVADIEATGRLGYVNGISRILINKLKELDVYTRPLHCTDYKRETIYIKDKDIWEKEPNEKPKLKQIVKIVAKKNLRQLPAWQEENPDFKEVATAKNDEFVKISLSCLGSSTPEDDERDTNKILRNVLKEVIVEKNLLT